MIDLNDLGNLSSDAVSGSAIDMPIAQIIEDPDQPRTVFDDASLKELSDSIKVRGVKSPISVRHGQDGKFIINHGARRYRASIMAGKDTIPAFIDDDYTRVDQAIENVQREDLTPLDIARFIESEKNRGLKSIDIASELGKSKAWVSQHAVLSKVPECIKAKIEAGAFVKNDVTAMADLTRLYQKNPEDVESFLRSFSGTESISRKDVRQLLESIKIDDEQDVNIEMPEPTEEEIAQAEAEAQAELDAEAEIESSKETYNEDKSEQSDDFNDDFERLDKIDNTQDKSAAQYTIKCTCALGEVELLIRPSQNGSLIVRNDFGEHEIPADELRVIAII